MGWLLLGVTDGTSRILGRYVKMQVEQVGFPVMCDKTSKGNKGGSQVRDRNIQLRALGRNVSGSLPSEIVTFRSYLSVVEMWVNVMSMLRLC